MRIIPLGTGSGKPTLRRNVSAVAAVWEGEWLLFDCGEATQIQVMKSGLHSSRLKAIFITHLHGDHFNGLAGFLSTMGLDRRESELTVVGPPGIKEYLDTVLKLRILYMNYPLDLREFGESRFADEGVALRKDGESRGNNARPLRVYESSNLVVSALPLNHRIYAIGFRVEERPRPGRFDLARARALGVPEGPLFGQLQRGNRVTLADGRTIEPSSVVGPTRPGKSVAYCTDTRPCESAIALGADADLMIHEATYMSDLESEAWQFGHSTARQAAESAHAAGARRLLITHISARYADATPLLKEAREVFPETELAEDLREVEV